MSWWIWILIGFGCLVLELATPGGIIMVFFGIAGIIVGLLLVTGLGLPLGGQILTFAALSIISLLTLRSRLLRRMKAGPPGQVVDSLVGQEVVLLSELVPGGVGQAELRGTVWEARTSAQRTLKKGQRCLVKKVDGLILWLQDEDEQVATGRPEGDS